MNTFEIPELQRVLHRFLDLSAAQHMLGFQHLICFISRRQVKIELIFISVRDTGRQQLFLTQDRIFVSDIMTVCTVDQRNIQLSVQLKHPFVVLNLDLLRMMLDLQIKIMTKDLFETFT